MRHVIDGPRNRGNERLRRYLTIDRMRDDQLHPKLLNLMTRSKGQYKPGLRAMAYARIERGHRA